MLRIEGTDDGSKYNSIFLLTSNMFCKNVTNALLLLLCFSKIFQFLYDIFICLIDSLVTHQNVFGKKKNSIYFLKPN